MTRAFGYRSEQRKRSENQDSFGVFEFEGFTLAIVCDGMGGHVGGAQASSLAVRTVHDALQNVTSNHGEQLRIALEKANQAIYEAARKNHRLMGMGTTAVAALLVDDGTVHIAHVGDSRAYLINEGQAIQVTRDHTMVNLFVDAELLTPEDAATHPEAHVLSRSLGVERQVEVEVSEPIELADNDVVFLCSDGVHGVVTDWELGAVDWMKPGPGVQHVLDIVEAREGDDNATAIAVVIGGLESMAPTRVPDPKSLELSLATTQPPGGATIIPDDEYEPHSDPDSYRTEPSAPPRETLPYTDDPPSGSGAAVESPRTPVSAPRGKAVEVAGPSRAPAEPAEPKAITRSPRPAARTNPLVFIVPVAAIGLGLVAMLGVVWALTRPVDDDDQTSDLVLNIDRPRPNAPRPTAPEPGPAPASDRFFAPAVPSAPRRLPHRPLRYTQPPPPGVNQFQAVQAARDEKCAESLRIVQDAMKISPDHAKLYSQSWLCFGETHARKLAEADVVDWRGFKELETHFRGWPEVGEPPIAWTPEETRLPSWYRPARDGVEHRLEAWQRSTDDDQFRDVMIDLRGEPSVADDLAVDVLVEAEAAAALARVEKVEEEIEEAWARRVYVASAAMTGRVGKMLRTNRPELVPRIEELLTAATTRPEGGPPIPASVVRALKVGRGEEAAPTAAPPRPVPSAQPLPDEPDLGGGDDRGGGTIYKK